MIVLHYTPSRSTCLVAMARKQPLRNPYSVDTVAKRAAGLRSREITELLSMPRITKVTEEYGRAHAQVQLSYNIEINCVNLCKSIPTHLYYNEYSHRRAASDISLELLRFSRDADRSIVPKLIEYSKTRCNTHIQFSILPYVRPFFSPLTVS